MTNLRAEYERRHREVLQPLALLLEGQIKEYLDGEPRVDRVQARAKSVDRFLEKASKIEDDRPKYDEPLTQIQDQVGARIVTFYLADVERISAVVGKLFRPIETRLLVPESPWAFGYFGLHWVFHIPNELTDAWDQSLVPDFFELQIKTLFQHAWSEANHDLGYKPPRDLTTEEQRNFAFTSAQAWGADRVFNDLHRSLGSQEGPMRR
ncbi:GTP pyrophosphokinase [Phenylobacterium sp.]|uniref:GTP pyrophosphokinase n=1 Tax=Phenylobacterium sp. TaxID=1871053 RepID=UPI002FC62EC0